MVGNGSNDRKNGKTDFSNLESAITRPNKLVSTSKAFYYARLGETLHDPTIQAKSYWPILKTFHNNKKLPLIPTTFGK